MICENKTRLVIIEHHRHPIRSLSVLPPPAFCIARNYAFNTTVINSETITVPFFEPTVTTFLLILFNLQHISLLDLFVSHLSLRVSAALYCSPSKRHGSCNLIGLLRLLRSCRDFNSPLMQRYEDICFLGLRSSSAACFIYLATWQ